MSYFSERSRFGRGDVKVLRIPMLPAVRFEENIKYPLIFWLGFPLGENHVNWVIRIRRGMDFLMPSPRKRPVGSFILPVAPGPAIVLPFLTLETMGLKAPLWMNALAIPRKDRVDN
jgi:hypothetical protein